MKFDLAMPHSDYARHGGLHVSAGVPVTWSAVKRLGTRLLKALRPQDYDEVYLNQAQNHADLERRILVLMSPARGHGPWQD